MKKTLALIILDGYGKSDEKYGNAILEADTPNLDYIFKNYPTTYISASGEDVGLPDGQMGNSEVGHTNIGAGRVVYQELVRISKSIKDNSIFSNKGLLEAIEHAKKYDSKLHIIGLVSDGGVHSHIEHLFGLIKMAKINNIKKLYIHGFLDGRDVSTTSGIDFIKKTEEYMRTLSLGKIASISGRYFAMDRDFAWNRVEKCFNAMTGKLEVSIIPPIESIKNSYENNITDEFFEPTLFDKNGVVEKNDAVIFFNYRPDRSRQLTHSFVDNKFNGFIHNVNLSNLKFTTMTQYDETIPNVNIAFHSDKIHETLGEIISHNGMTQLRIAETQKYAHVTFFFNGGVEAVFPGEDRCLIQSPNVPTFDLQPEMSAYEVTDKVVEKILSRKYDLIILNYANCDMVGHTGNFKAAKDSVEHLDKCIKKVIDAIKSIDGKAIVTADHGNAEKMIDQDGNPFTPHTLSLVPFAIINHPVDLKDKGKLSDIAPTICDILKIEKPISMTGISLIK